MHGLAARRSVDDEMIQATSQAANEQTLRKIGRAFGYLLAEGTDLDGLAEVANIWGEVRFQVISLLNPAGAAVMVNTPSGRTVDLLPHLHAVIRKHGSGSEVQIAAPRFPYDSGFSIAVTSGVAGAAISRDLKVLAPDHPQTSTAADLKAAEVITAGTRGGAVEAAGSPVRSLPARRPGPGRAALSKAERQARWRKLHRVVALELPADVADHIRIARAERGMTIAELLTAALEALGPPLRKGGRSGESRAKGDGQRLRISVTG